MLVTFSVSKLGSPLIVVKLVKSPKKFITPPKTLIGALKSISVIVDKSSIFKFFLLSLNESP